MTTITGVHPYAEMFPLLPDDELEELAESIRVNGLRQPIVITPDGLILDGRNRWAACQRAGVEPHTVVYEGDDLAEYVINANIQRRHMSTGAPAMATALVLAEAGRRTGGRWKRGSVPADNRDSSVSSAWEQAMRQAGTVLDQAPELAPGVVGGETALDHAYGLAKAARHAEQAGTEAGALPSDEDAARAYVEKHAPDLVELVADGTYRSYRQAAWWAHYLEGQRLTQERSDRDWERRQTTTYTSLTRTVRFLAQLDSVLGVDTVLRGLEPEAGVDPGDLAPDALRHAAHFLAKLAEWAERRTSP